MRKVKYVIHSPVLQVTTDPFDTIELAEEALAIIVAKGVEDMPYFSQEDIIDLFQIEGRSYIEAQN